MYDSQGVEYFVGNGIVVIHNGFVDVFERGAEVGEFLGIICDFWQVLHQAPVKGVPKHPLLDQALPGIDLRIPGPKLLYQVLLLWI